MTGEQVEEEPLEPADHQAEQYGDETDDHSDDDGESHDEVWLSGDALKGLSFIERASLPTASEHPSTTSEPAQRRPVRRPSLHPQSRFVKATRVVVGRCRAGTAGASHARPVASRSGSMDPWPFRTATGSPSRGFPCVGRPATGLPVVRGPLPDEVPRDGGAVGRASSMQERPSPANGREGRLPRGLRSLGVAVGRIRSGLWQGVGGHPISSLAYGNAR